MGLPFCLCYAKIFREFKYTIQWQSEHYKKVKGKHEDIFNDRRWSGQTD